MMHKHFVTFYSPGTIMTETTERSIDTWNITKAMALAKSILERHGAWPYGFRFTTRARTTKKLDSKVVNTSACHFINCRLRTRAQVDKDNLPDEEILRANLHQNKITHIAQTIMGWRSSLPLRPGDTIWNADGTKAFVMPAARK